MAIQSATANGFIPLRDVEDMDVIKGKKGGFQLRTLERTYLLQADNDEVPW
jgi:hypothetical protein